MMLTILVFYFAAFRWKWKKALLAICTPYLLEEVNFYSCVKRNEKVLRSINTCLVILQLLGVNLLNSFFHKNGNAHKQKLTGELLHNTEFI